MQPTATKDGAGNWDLDSRLSRMIRFRARELACSPGFRRRDEEDLRQELALHIVTRLPKHDLTRAAANTYIDRLLTNKVRDLVRRVKAQRRDQSREVSFDRLPVRQLDELRVKGWGHDRHVYLRVNLHDALASVTADDREVALSLAEHNVAEVSRRTGRSRQSVRSARQRVRRHLERYGVTPS